jgi:dTMP kinase
VPDLYLGLDLAPVAAAARARRAAGRPDRIEREGEGFRRTVREAYLALAGSEPGVEVLSAQGTPEEVHGRIRDRILARFPQLFPAGRSR